MSALSRIPGVASLASFVAVTFSLHSNPTLRKYNDLLAHAFYHHGRVCASNQATVMVLVIVFVGMIAYPGIVTSYNSSAYARHRSATAATTEHDITLSDGFTARHQEANLDTFWAKSVVAPTWSQDPRAFGRSLPSPDPLHYLAPVIINATDLHPFQHYTNGTLDLENNSSAEQDPTNTPWSEADLFAFTTKIQERILNIAIQYPPHEDNKSGHHKPTVPPRLVTLRDICLLEPAESSNQAEDEDSTMEQPQDTGRGCLVHSPLIYRDDGPAHVGSDIDLNGTLEQYRHKSSSNSLFGGLSLDRGLSPDHPSLSLVITFFLRGDLGVQAPTGPYDDSSATDKTSAGKTHHDPLDVRQIWRLIFKQLQIELQAERAKKAQARLFYHTPTTSENDNSLLSAEEGTEGQEEQDAGNDIADVPSSGDSIPDPLSQFLVRALPVQETGQSGSRRLVSEEHAQPRTNISAEYWLLGMAYFVMFLYISLSVGRVDLVKSKYGLGIAAVATVFVSLLMSIGLCSVFGVTLTLMPWEILPFMIIVVGVENINILVHAVVETSMDLPVRERVGRGLGTVGVSITMTLVAELCLLIIGAMTTIPAVQEFCTFAIAAVIMDYLLQMTFFITVISIDIRRLELSDLGRPAAPYSRYPFGSRHSATKSSLFPGDNEMAVRFSGIHATNGMSILDGNDSKHRRKDSTGSLHSDEDSRSHDKPGNKNRKGRIFTSIIMVGVMAYLGYIYGTTNQSTPTVAVTESYWRIIPPEASTEFWAMIDPERQGGYLEIESPAVLTLWRPLNGTHDIPCDTKTDVSEFDNCDSQQDASEEAHAGSKQDSDSSQTHTSQLDPRRPFKFLWETLVFVCLFAYWLVRVFVIPSIILAASILLLLSYLLSPQRKLLVDLQWSFPFIVLPGDYQSKRKLMMEELLAQEARELGQDPGACSPLPGSVETLYKRGHKTDIDQMDVSPDQGLILTSSMDGSILLWSGVAGHGQEMPLAKLEEGACLKTSPINNNIPSVRVTAAFTTPVKSPRSKVGSLKCLKLDSSGTFAAGGYADGAVHVWNVDQVAHGYGEQGMGRVPSLRSTYGMVRDPSTTTDQAKLRVGSIYFWEAVSRPEAGSFLGEGLSLMAGYRDGQIWQWNPVNGEGDCVAETRHRGGIAELAMVELNPKTRQDLGLTQRTFMVAAGKDGGIQCWSASRRPNGSLDTWSMLWGQAGQAAGGSVSVLSLDAEVPMVAVGYSTGAIKIWDLEHGNLVWTLSRGSTVPGASALSGPSKLLDRRFSQGEPDNHQPSHQGSITKLCFHALELEDGLTGEPAPRVWLVISSGVDEAVMVWMVEWEGLMALPTPLRQPTPLGHPTQNGHEYFAGHDGSKYGQTHDRFRTNGSRDWKSNQGNIAGHLDILGMLSSSLPAPRLVGFMKQRGGRSMTVSNSRLYGVRRTESTTAHAAQLNTPPKQSHASIAETSGPVANIIRSRRKSDGHVLSSTAAGQDRQTASGSHPTKRGWELWEADLYQCIFKTPGVWSLDLTIRAINLQPPLQRRPSLPARSHLDSTRRPSMATDVFNSGTPGTITVASNGSGIATQVVLNQHHGLQAGLDMEYGQQDGNNAQTRPKIQRRPGSFTNQGGQQGYVFTTGVARLSPSGQRPEYGQSLHPTMSGVGGVDDSWGSFRAGGAANDEDSESMLLPFVETRLIHAILRGPSSREADVETWDPMDSAKAPELKDIVIGFGNYIKIVRLMDEDEEIMAGDQ